jgi:hypothetical protein
MKNLSITLLIMLLVAGSALAQQKTKSNLPYKNVEEGVPQAVLTAIEKNNQGFYFQNQKELAVLPKAKIKTKTPRVEVPKAISPEIVYTSRERRASESGKIRSLKNTYYDANGTIISSREVTFNKALPFVALRTIGENYDGWLLERTRSVIEEKGNMRTVYYSAVVKNGKDRKLLLMNSDGKLIKDKKDQPVYVLKAKR